MASNYVISLYLYSLEGNKGLEQIGRKKGVVLPKKAGISDRYNRI